MGRWSSGIGWAGREIESKRRKKCESGRDLIVGDPYETVDF